MAPSNAKALVREHVVIGGNTQYHPARFYGSEGWGFESLRARYIGAGESRFPALTSAPPGAACQKPADRLIPDQKVAGTGPLLKCWQRVSIVLRGRPAR